MQSPKHNVVIFGETGSGKSSIVNMIVGKPVAPVSSSFLGCTFKHERYETSLNNTRFCIYDTAGLSEGDQGRVPHWTAVRELYTLIRCLDSVSLLIYCMRGKIRRDAPANWILFNKVLCAEKVPIIAVATGLEQEQDLDGKRKEIKEALNMYGMFPNNVECVVSIRGRNNEHKEIYDSSQRQLRNRIEESYRRKPWSTATDDWIAHIFKTTYNTKLCLLPDVRVEFVNAVGNVVDEFIKETGMKKDDADKLKATLLQAEKKLRKNSSRLSGPNHLKPATTHNVVIFGETCSGKSSIVNMIVGEPVAKVSSNFLGTTLKHECYETSLNNIRFCIYDTAGLNEGDQGRVPHRTAVRELYTLIRCLDSVSLLIYCMRGEIKENAPANWILFNKVLCAEEVPIIAVATGLEQEQDLDGKRAQVKKELNMYGMFPNNVECVVSIRGRNNEHKELYDSSQRQLRNRIEESYSRQPWSTETDEWIAHIFKTTYNTKLCFLRDVRVEFVNAEGNVVDEFIKETGMKEDDADMLKATLLRAETMLQKKKKKGG